LTEGPIAGYRALLRAGDLRPDPAQELAAEKLQTLFLHLRGYQPPVKRGWRRRLGLEQSEDPPQGLYLYGGVGRGKTMLMDLFFDRAPVERKRRTHFHAFMTEVHARIHEWRKDGREHGFRAGADPIPPLAAAIADQAWLLCFDEFEVLDIADAMILGRLFKTLIEDGVVVVTTSNRPPRELYLDGLQRDRFEPFIDLAEERFDILHLDGEVDYRLNGLRDAKVYFAPLGVAAEAALDESFARLAGGAQAIAETIMVQGREVPVPAANRGIARFGFSDLCEQPLGAADYLAIAHRYHTVVVSGVPVLSPEQRNEARRFATMIDIFYDHAVKFICSADGPPDSLYLHGTGTFEFQRTASRLIEMQTGDYLGRRHEI
jgi:cell division protein ZapE